MSRQVSSSPRRWMWALGAIALIAADPARARPSLADRAPAAPTFGVVARPQGVAVGRDSVWVASLGARAIVRLDPADARVLGVTPLDFPPLGLSLGAGALWITGGFDTVARLDPQTNRVVARIRVGLNPRIPAATDDAIWIPNAGDGTISRISPRANQVVATIALAAPLDCPTSPEPLAVIAADGAVWATRCAARAVSRIDPATNRVAQTIALGVEPTALALVGGELWVTSAAWDQVLRIEPGAGRVVARLRLAGPGAIAGGAAGVWVGAESGAIVRVDPRTNRLTTVRGAAARPVGPPPSPVPSLPGLPARGILLAPALQDAVRWAEFPADVGGAFLAAGERPDKVQP
jgi:DNA-binding beta-propeller fold protein YncE